MGDSELLIRYQASMVLSGVGDAVGFKNGGWEFNNDGESIHKDLKKLGGVKKLRVALPKWRVSDDTVMHLATAEALAERSGPGSKEDLYVQMAVKYKECMNDMQGRSPGLTCMSVTHSLKPGRPEGYHTAFNKRGGGCGAAMRAMCIGLCYPGLENIDDLIAVSVESGRMTHHHPTGYLGALAAALFTSYAIQRKPVKEWGRGLMSVLPRALQYVESQCRYVEENKAHWSYFTTKWQDYLKERGIVDGESDPVFPEGYGVKVRDKVYNSWSYSGWGGASGHDAPMIAYDALLGAGDDWEELVKRGMLHGGDSDSTGVIAAACFGAMYGFSGVPEINYKELEYKDRLLDMGTKLFKLSQTGRKPETETMELPGKSCNEEENMELSQGNTKPSPGDTEPSQGDKDPSQGGPEPSQVDKDPSQGGTEQTQGSSEQTQGSGKDSSLDNSGDIKE